MDWKRKENISAALTAPPRREWWAWRIGREIAGRCGKMIRMGESALNVIADGAGETLRCLRCGYDLRGFAAERCSECGWEIDRDLLSGGSFPWERRRFLGRFLSYIKTVWEVSIGSRKLADA